MTITQPVFKNMILTAAENLDENKDMISQIDSLSGDGLYAKDIGTVAGVMKDHAQKYEKQSFTDFLKSLGREIIENCCGLGGFFYGTMLSGMGDGLSGAGSEICAMQLKQMFYGGLNSMQGVTPAQVGDKTVMDAIIPATKAAASAPNDVSQVLRAAASGAVSGAASSAGLSPKYVKNTENRPYVMGTPDAGAVSAAIMFSGFVYGISPYSREALTSFT